MLDSICLVPTDKITPIPGFDWFSYQDTENELRMLFPEIGDRRANYCQQGLTAALYVGSDRTGELDDQESYFFMPDYVDGRPVMRPIRMAFLRKVTLAEFRMAYHTSLKMRDLSGTAAGNAIESLGREILGEELLAEITN